MKRAVIAVIILVSVTISAAAVNLMLSQKTERLYVLAESATYSKTRLEEFDTEWNRQLIYFKLFTDHAYFEPLDKKIKKLAYIEGGQYEVICTEVMLDIAALKEHISFSFANVF